MSDDASRADRLPAASTSAEERLRHVAAQVPGALYQYRVGADGWTSFPYASDGLEDVFEVSPAEARADASCVWARIHPDDVDRVAAAVRASSEALTPWQQEYRVRLPGRGVRWLRGEATPRREPDGATLWHGYISDVTEQKAREQALATLSRRLEVATVGTGVGVWEWALDGQSLHLDETMYRLLGWDPEGGPYDSRALFRRVHPEDRPTLEAVAQRLLETGEPQEVDVRVRRGDGQLRWIRGRAVLVEDVAGGAATIVGTNEDITHRKLADEALRRSEGRLRSAVDATGEGVWDWQIPENVVSHNMRWCDMLGLDASFLEHPLEDFARFLHPEDHPRVVRRIEAALQSDAPYFSEHRLIRADGQTIWVEDRGAVIARADDGSPLRMIGSFRDVTAHRRQEQERLVVLERLESFFEMSLEMLCITDTRGRFLKVNPTWCRVLGYRRDELEGRPWIDLVHPDDVKATLDAGRTLEEGRPLHGFVNRYRCADGSHRVIEWRAQPHRGLFHAAARDVTELREREAALRAAKEAAERANQAKSTFLANMSHEIRTPMNGVLGAAELLRLGSLDEDQRELVGMIAGSSEALLTVINDILDFSRVEAGRLSLEALPFDLGEVVEGALTPFLAQARTGPVSLEARLAPGLWTRRFGDPARIRQILVNLVGNAMKFTERGSVVVEASEAHGLVALAVRDTGVGIPADRLGSLFDPFEQVDASTSRRFGGTGLGLAICRRLAQLMGGRVDVESALGVGSTFTVRLPLPMADRSIAPRSLPPLPSLRPPGRPVRVLVAEDNAVNQRIASRMLEQLGAEVTVVGDGAAAVEAVRDDPPDLVLMDVQMPRVDGYEATARIRALEAGSGRRTRVVALTANAMPADRERAFAADMDDHVPKPLRLRALRLQIDRLRD